MQYQELRHLQCAHGHYLPRSTDASVARDVQHEKVECLDCRDIATVRRAHHKKHTEETCDCDSYATWVARYLPRATN